MSANLRKFVVVPLLIVLGIQSWLILGRSDFSRPFQLKLLLAAAILSFIPPVNRFVYSLIERVRFPSMKARYIAAIVIAVISSIYLVETAWFQNRNFQPKWQDEQSYIIQFRMLAQGRLWMPRHPLGDFFDSFQVIIDPVYASMYFPGASFFYVWATLTDLPYWLISALMAGATVGLIYLIMTELIDGWAGVLAVFLMLGTSLFRFLSILIGGHPPLLLLEMMMIWSYLSWRRTQRTPWIVALGVASGWAAITRPLDAVVVALPIGIMMLLDLRGFGARRGLRIAGCLVAGALPFLMLQLIVNSGVTGKWYRTPFEHYADRDYPGTTLGFHKYDPTKRPVSQLPQKQKYHDVFTAPAIQRHQPEKMLTNWIGKDVEHPGDLQRTLAEVMPHRLLIILLPLGFLGLTNRGRWAVWLVLPAFIVMYSFYTFSLRHYAIIAIPSVILLVLLGANVLENTWPRARSAIATFIALFILIMSITEMPEVNRISGDELFEAPPIAGLAAQLRQLPHTPAVVLFRFNPKNVPDEEPVYNIDAAWPDEAEVIRAHDLRDRNIEIFRYYAEVQPERSFYRYDRGDNSIRFLGLARDLARTSTTREGKAPAEP